MDDRTKLFETLRKIEALYAGAATPGERDAAASARERIRARLESVAQQERSEEYRFSMDNPGRGRSSLRSFGDMASSPIGTVVNDGTPSWPACRGRSSKRRSCPSSRK